MELGFKDGVRDCIPTLFGYVGIGIAAGVVSKAANLSVLEITLLAIFVYAGASQFIIAGLMFLATPIGAIIFTVFLVNSRHFLMGMAIAPYFKKDSLLNNIAIGSLLTDETFAVAMNAVALKQPINCYWMHGLNSLAYLFWVLSCFIGAMLGEWLPNPLQFGLDYALVAMFIGLLYLQLMSDKNKKILSRISVIISVVLLLTILMKFMSAELALLLATLISCFIGVCSEKWI